MEGAKSIEAVITEWRDGMEYLSSIFYQTVIYEQTHKIEEQRVYFITINSSPINFFRRIVYTVTTAPHHYGSLQPRPLQNRRYFLRNVCLLQKKIKHSLIAQNLLFLSHLLSIHVNIGEEHVDDFSSLHTSSISRFDRSSHDHSLLRLRSKYLVGLCGDIGRVEQQHIHLVLGVTRSLPWKPSIAPVFPAASFRGWSLHGQSIL